MTDSSSPPDLHPSIELAIQQIDAALFAGDAFDDPRAHAYLRGYVVRWLRRLQETVFAGDSVAATPASPDLLAQVSAAMIRVLEERPDAEDVQYVLCLNSDRDGRGSFVHSYAYDDVATQRLFVHLAAALRSRGVGLKVVTVDHGQPGGGN